MENSISKISVCNMLSPRTDNKVANQFLITTPEGEYFQSYMTVIAFKRNDGKVFLNHAWDYSITTGKYRNSFLDETKKETKEKIENGTYEITNLNG